MAKLGLLTRAFVGAAGGAARQNLANIEEQGKAKRERALAGYKQEFALELEEIRATNNLAMTQLREGAANFRAEQASKQRVGLAATAKQGATERFDIAETGRREGRLQQAEANAQAAKDRSTAALATKDFRKAQVEADKAATEYNTLALEARTEESRRRYEKAETDARRAAELARQRFDARETAEQRRFDKEQTAADRRLERQLAVGTGDKFLSEQRKVNLALVWARVYAVTTDDFRAQSIDPERLPEGYNLALKSLNETGKLPPMPGEDTANPQAGGVTLPSGQVIPEGGFFEQNGRYWTVRNGRIVPFELGQ